MQKLYAFFTLVRFPNLIFIVVTQFLTHQYLILPVLNSSASYQILANSVLFLFLLSTVCIAAAGYIINDYFDISIDAVNKPERVTIEKFYKRRTIISWHIVLNLVALILASCISLYYLQLRYVLVQVICVLLLLFYSVTFKRKFLIGNLVIAILTALTLLSIAIFEVHFPLGQLQLPEVSKFWIYVVFAFLITLCREIVKDIEDIKGDGEQGCDTLPLRLGISKAKWLVYTLMFFILALVAYLLMYFVKAQSLVFWYWIGLVVLPILFISLKLYYANSTAHFRFISSLFKWVTLSGILSMMIS
ncbi:MAG: geranylgeranylglycerol-phosphate geranylgeranyltransferase [Bacteroidetes bacterium]|nr:geranylgeranylglycerol-phosphate geranylgeranyltransferase [Bacteroidota bacterium]